MTNDEVLALMGTATVRTRERTDIIPTLTVSNPYRTETMLSKNGETFVILFYLTDLKKDDDAITDDELEPIVMREGRVIGWGWSFLDQAVQKYEIRVR